MPKLQHQVVQLAQVEIHQPGVFGRLVRLVLAVVAIGQAAVKGMVVAFGIDRAVPGLFLEQHDLAEGVEDRRQRPRARDARVVVHAIPGRDGGMDVAVGCAEMELRLDLRGQPGAVFHGSGRLRGIAAHPGVLKLIFGRAADQVGRPELVHRGEVGVVVIRAVNEAQLVLKQPGVIVLASVSPLAGRGRVRKVKLSPSSRQPVSWSVITTWVMPQRWQSVQKRPSCSRFEAGWARQRCVPVTCFQGEAGFGMVGKTSS